MAEVSEETRTGSQNCGGLVYESYPDRGKGMVPKQRKGEANYLEYKVAVNEGR